MAAPSTRKVVPIVPVAGPDEEVSLYEAHQKVYPRSVKGRFATLRWLCVWITQIVFYGLPWIYWNDRQAVVFDLAARKFYIFGLVLWPQDFIYLTGLLVICALALFLFTAVAGRVWCGYACPQTVYTEIFLWVERHTEGDRAARMKLDAGPWTANKFARKFAKQMVWIGFALWTGYTFVGYFTPIRLLGAEMMNFSLGSWEVFWVLFYGFATYGNAGFLREQVCKHMCPYARFQGAMFDNDTLIVTYDAERGEPRGARSRKETEGAVSVGSADCIDCTLCVQVCPTGIDIRDGLQVGCIACAACIDVCDTVMDKVGTPRGLIRYSTERELSAHIAPAEHFKQMFKRLMRPRVLLYSVVLGVLSIALLTSLLVLRKPFRVDVIRDRGALARVTESGLVENTYRLQIMNASEHPQRFSIEVSGVPGLRIASEDSILVASADSRSVAVRLQTPVDHGKPGSNPIRFHVTAGPTEDLSAPSITEKSIFLVPL
ncbi:MAG TPA: cytochrome c oxidase accessory protein CcoG [Rhodocyclaceae bacterium]|nr:cytochrome c oxidase accessory protein CcoG [Rhodocyclaceae bacterium]